MGGEVRCGVGVVVVVWKRALAAIGGAPDEHNGGCHDVSRPDLISSMIF